MAGVKTEKVKQQIVRYIRDTKMKRGDRLPPQDFFRKEFKCGMATVNAAINKLKADRVLQVRDKVGVFVLSPNADGHAGYIVGITTRWVQETPYYSSMLGALQRCLIKKGCQVNIFCYDEAKQENLNQTTFPLNDFPGLTRSIEANEIEGLIHLDDFPEEAYGFIDSHGIPAVFVGSQGGNAKNGLFYDQEGLLSDICRKLKKLNSKNPALCLPEAMRPHFEPLFKKLTAGAGTVYSGSGLKDGNRIAEEMLARESGKAHDHIIYLDDIIAQKVTSIFALKMAPDKCPRAIIMRGLQLLLSFPAIDPVFYNINLIEAAEQASDILLKAMNTKSKKVGRIYYKIKEGK
jgi:DNA-binding LacI/PurR family transcriptional regulator